MLIACSGEGYWAHGRDAAQKVVKKMDYFNGIKKDAKQKIAAREELIN